MCLRAASVCVWLEGWVAPPGTRAAIRVDPSRGAHRPPSDRLRVGPVWAHRASPLDSERRRASVATRAAVTCSTGGGRRRDLPGTAGCVVELGEGGAFVCAFAVRGEPDGLRSLSPPSPGRGHRPKPPHGNLNGPGAPAPPACLQAHRHTARAPFPAQSFPPQVPSRTAHHPRGTRSRPTPRRVTDRSTGRRCRRSHCRSTRRRLGPRRRRRPGPAWGRRATDQRSGRPCLRVPHRRRTGRTDSDCNMPVLTRRRGGFGWRSFCTWAAVWRRGRPRSSPCLSRCCDRRRTAPGPVRARRKPP